MEVETHRKLVLTYEPPRELGEKEPKPQSIEMKFSEKESLVPLAESCDSLNYVIARLVDNAKFHIVEVKIFR